MQFKLTIERTYNEILQVNPLRWKILYRDGELFTDQTGWIKCKDFFNDVVASLRNIKFHIYNFNNDLKKNEEGFYILLKHIQNKESFEHNIGILNEKLSSDLGVSLSLFSGSNPDEFVILIPTKCWENTYCISLLTLCIRLSNYGVVYEKWEDWWATGSPGQQQERYALGINYYGKKIINHILKYGFTLPDTFKEFWWYSDEQYNSKNISVIGAEHIFHEDGIVSWCRNMT